MSTANRYRFKPDQPIPEGGVTTPNVFPDLVHPQYGRLRLHDVFEGLIPRIGGRQLPPQKGWLKIASGNDTDYISPDMSQTEREHLQELERDTIKIGLDVTDTAVIRRVSTTLVAAALEAPEFNGVTFTVANNDRGSNLVKVTPVEQAIFYRGIASIQGREALVNGIHFDSGEELGWVEIGDAPTESPNPAT